jgi:phospholipase/carboxylesterase
MSRFLDASPEQLTRRAMLRRMLAGGTAIAGGAFRPGLFAAPAVPGDGRLQSRPRQATGSIATGLRKLGVGGGRDGLLYVPTSYRSGTPAPLAVLFHGAGRASNELVEPMRDAADEVGLVLVAPDSRSATWDATYGSFGPDTDYLDAALARVFTNVVIDAARIRVAGFSDGASYALSIGRINGDLFSRIAAFSPGFVAPGTPRGKPKVFIAHGTQDTILPIDATSRRIVPSLRSQGYDVEYHEFDGPHAIALDLLRSATTWLAAR